MTLGRVPRENDFNKGGKPTIVWHMWFQALRRIVNEVLGTTINITPSDSPYTIVTAGINLVCNTNSGSIIVNYPPGTANSKVRVSNSGTSNNNVSLVGDGTDLIKGESTQTLYDDETLNSVFDITEGWF